MILDFIYVSATKDAYTKAQTSLSTVWVLIIVMLAWTNGTNKENKKENEWVREQIQGSSLFPSSYCNGDLIEKYGFDKSEAEKDPSISLVDKTGLPQIAAHDAANETDPFCGKLCLNYGPVFKWISYWMPL